MFGFLIGLAIAAIIFGVSWLNKNGNQNALKTQTLQQSNENQTAPLATIPARTIPVPGENAPESLVNRLAPSEEVVIQDIQKNLQQLYGPSEAN